MSIALHQFPQFVWREGKKRLWNPIHRKALKNRPEERVRLRVIEFLIEAGWSPHRISTEEALNLPKGNAALRTDIICYTQEFLPRLLVECKAGQIDISEQTARQIARYNQHLSAPYLLMTNGLRDYWYALGKGQPLVPLKSRPPIFSALKEPSQKPFKYWMERGFAGHQAAPSLRSWLKKTLHDWWLQPQATPARFLAFNSNPATVDLNHYYKIEPVEEGRIALSFLNTPFGDSRLVGIFNAEGQNKGVIEVNLDLLFDDCTPNTIVYRAGDIRNIDLRKEADWQPQSFELRPFAQKLLHLF